MSDRTERAPNRGLIAVLLLVGLVFGVMWLRGCRAAGMHYGWFPWDHSWRSSLFGPFYGLISIWWLLSLVLAVWVAVDANRRGLNGFLWGLLTFFTGIIGLIVYLLVSPGLAARNGAPAGPTPATPAPLADPPATERCTGCGAALAADFKVCPHCGAAARATCRSCGRVLRPEWKVCPYCATPAGTAPPGSGNEPPKPPDG